MVEGRCRGRGPAALWLRDDVCKILAWGRFIDVYNSTIASRAGARVHLRTCVGDRSAIPIPSRNAIDVYHTVIVGHRRRTRPHTYVVVGQPAISTPSGPAYTYMYIIFLRLIIVIPRPSIALPHLGLTSRSDSKQEYQRQVYTDDPDVRARCPSPPGIRTCIGENSRFPSEIRQAHRISRPSPCFPMRQARCLSLTWSDPDSRYYSTLELHHFRLPKVRIGWWVFG